MDDLIDSLIKPEDYDEIIYGETRFVIFEKKEDVSKNFISRMKPYIKFVVKKHMLPILDLLEKHKHNINT